MGFELKKSVSTEWLAGELNLDFSLSTETPISNIAALNDADHESLVFSKQDCDKNVAAIICKPTSDLSNNLNVIFSDNPRLDFIRSLEILTKKIGFEINETAPQIHSTAIIGNNVSIENNVKIGENSVIEPNSVIMNGTEIGDNCLIRAGAVIGSDGFGFERDVTGTPIKFIHFGGVIIGNNVEIGANTCISKGTLGHTIIEDNVKIDNLVHIAHNCILRNGCFITACAELSGGVEVGKNVWIAPNATITQKISIGDNSVIGIGAVLTKNVPSYHVFAGYPAKKIRVIPKT